MYAQLFLGVFFVIKGIVECLSRRTNFFVSRAMVDNITQKEELPKYLRKIGIAHVLLGILIITMGQIEYRMKPDLSTFIIAYIILGCSYLMVITLLNKRYSGYYFLR